MREAQGEEITLPPELWEAAAVEQEERLEDDPWLEKLAMVRGRALAMKCARSPASCSAKCWTLTLQRQHSGHAKRLAGLMRSLGWEQDKFKVAGKTIRGFRRPKPEGHVDDKIPIRFKQPFLAGGGGGGGMYRRSFRRVCAGLRGYWFKTALRGGPRRWHVPPAPPPPQLRFQPQWAWNPRIHEAASSRGFDIPNMSRLRRWLQFGHVSAHLTTTGD